MVIKAVCVAGLGSSLLIEMNVRSVMDKLNIDYEEVSHTNLSSFSPAGVDLIVVGADIASSIDFPEDKKIVLTNLLSSSELEEKLKKYFKIA